MQKKNTIIDRSIVIDCGHGGDDPGFNGQGLSEKEFALILGLKLAQQLRAQGYTVHMTRDDDKTLSLDERTGYANKCSHADALISLHGNANINPAVCGIETYFMTPELFKTTLNLMNHEDTHHIDSHRKELAKKSEKLAMSVHKDLIKEAQKFQNVVDRKVKKQPGQVLFGDMPSILVECGFLSNPEEYALLVNTKYQDALVSGMVSGLGKFFETSFA